MNTNTKNYFYSTEKARPNNWLGLTLTIAVIFVSVFTAGTALACANGSTLTLQEFISDRNAGSIHGDVSLSGSTANGTVTNNTECAMTATLASFNKIDGSYANQTTYQQMSVTVPAHSSASASVGIPSCSSQIDLYYGTYYSHSANGIDLMDLAYTHNDGPYCTTTVPDPTLSASCSASPSSVNLGSPINWSATASGGNGLYAYTWVGTDGFSASGASTSKTYSNAGSKVATVTVTSGGQSATANCSAMVNTPTPDLAASCSASPSSVNLGASTTWSATASGGTGSYTYSWVGTDGLSDSGSYISKTYTNAGSKVATVTVTSGGQSATANCSAMVNTPTQNLVVSCLASPSSVNLGSPINWSATASGGNGSYAYTWVGTDGFSASGASTSKTYSNAGSKVATVTVTSGGQSATANCSAMVNTPTQNLAVSCLASPSSIQTNSSATFSANATGGTGSYVYSWTGACIGPGSACSNTFPVSGTQVATVSVTSGGQSATANCSVSVSSNPINVTCSANPATITSGQATTFIASATGGSGSYTYLWSGACSGVGLTCNNNIYSTGSQTATVVVTSGSQTATAYCSVSAGQSCTPNYQQRCVGTSMYWYDSCGAQGNYVGSCGNTCTPNYQQRCVGTSMYWYDSCGAQGSYVGSCGQTYTNASLTMTKTVRDLTTGNAFANSTYANPSDMLMFMITLQATGNQDVQNVIVRDTLPANLIYRNQLVVARSNNTYNNYSGDIIYGLNLNTISAGQIVTITYQAQVASALNFSYGTTTLNNLVSVTSSNANAPTATASAIVTRSTVLGASTVSTGLTNNFWVDSFFLPLLIALIGIWMIRAGVFFGVEKWFDNRKKIRRGYKTEKELSSRIETIKKFGR